MRADAQADPDARSNTALHKDFRWNLRLVWLPDLNQDKSNHEHSGEHKTENPAPFAPLKAEHFFVFTPCSSACILHLSGLELAVSTLWELRGEVI